MKRADRSALVKALQAFEDAAKRPEDNAAVIQAAVKWENMFRQHETKLTARDVERFKQRASVALNKAMA